MNECRGRNDLQFLVEHVATWSRNANANQTKKHCGKIVAAYRALDDEGRRSGLGIIVRIHQGLKHSGSDIWGSHFSDGCVVVRA